MQCPTCKKDMIRPWKGMITRMGVEFEVAGQRCGSCGETIFEGDEVQRQEREIATALVARGVRTAAEFKFVRKMAGFRANEIAELLGVSPRDRLEVGARRSGDPALSCLCARRALRSTSGDAREARGIRAMITSVRLLGEMRISAAIGPMLRALAETDPLDMLHDAILVSMPEIGESVVEPALRAYAEDDDLEFRASVGSILARVGVRDDRTRL